MRRIIALLSALFIISCSLSSALADAYAVNFSGGSASVNEQGETLIPAGIYDELYVLRGDNGNHTGYAAGLLIDGHMLYAVLDSSGNVLTGFEYSSVQGAGNGCIVSKDGIYRYLTGDGIYENYQFSALKYINGGRVLAVTGNRYDDIGDILTILWPEGISFQTGIRTINDFSEYSEGLMPLYDDETGLFGYIGTDGAWEINPSFHYAGDFKNGLAVIATENGYGVSDNEGRIVLSAGSRTLLRSDNAFAAIRGDILRLYDNNLNEMCAIPLNGANISLTGKYAVIYQPSNACIYDLSGVMLFELPAEASVTSVNNERFIIRTGTLSEKSIALYSTDGAMLSEAKHTMYALDDTVVAYGIYNESGTMMYGLMDIDGNTITEAVYLSMARVADGMYCAENEVGAVLLNAEGSVINTFTVSDSEYQN